jgi:hypothetical protein
LLNIFTIQKEDTAIANFKPKKLITYRKPKVSTTAKQISKSLLNTSSSATNKVIRSLAKQQSETNNRYINIMEAQQSINFIFANIRLRSRRMHRENLGHERLVRTGKADGYIRTALGWLADYLLFVFDLIWAVIQPILLILVMLIMRLVLMIVFTAIGLYIFYKLITA